MKYAFEVRRNTSLAIESLCTLQYKRISVVTGRDGTKDPILSSEEHLWPLMLQVELTCHAPYSYSLM